MCLTSGVSVAALQRDAIMFSMVLITMTGKADPKNMSPHVNSALIIVTWGKGFHRYYHKEIILGNITREETSVPTISLQMSLVLEENAVESKARDGNSVATGEGIQKPLEAIRNLQWFLSRLDPLRDLSQVSSLLWNSGVQNKRDHSLVFSTTAMVYIDCQLDRI